MQDEIAAKEKLLMVLKQKKLDLEIQKMEQELLGSTNKVMTKESTERSEIEEQGVIISKLGQSSDQSFINLPNVILSKIAKIDDQSNNLVFVVSGSCLFKRVI